MPAIDAIFRARTDDAQIVAGEVRADAGFAGRRSESTRSWLLVATLDGTGRLDSPGRAEQLTRAELMLVRPGAATTLWSTAPDAATWSFAWIHFCPRRAWEAWLDWPGIGDGHGRLRIDPDGDPGRAIVARILDVCRLSTGPDPLRDALAANALEQTLLWCDALRHAPSARQAPRDDRIVAVADWLCRNLGQPITLDRVAEQAGLSVSRLAHRFRDEMGIAPLQYLERQRMRRAHDLLAMTSLTVAEVATSVGFENVAYFTTRFRKASGATPDAFRRRVTLDMPTAPPVGRRNVTDERPNPCEPLSDLSASQ